MTVAKEQQFVTTPVVSRIHSIDILRGLIMVIMALDHVREFWSPTPFQPTDMDQTSVPLFFTRWVTHFCAPIFVFLSGVSIYLYERRAPSRKAVSSFLLTRGLWLIVVELVVINFLTQWGYPLILIQVIWAIGWSMILLAALIWLPRQVLAVIALAVIAGHNLIPNIATITPATIVPAILHNAPFFLQVGGKPVLVAYTIFPWATVMLTGYLVGKWFSHSPERLNRNLKLTGMILLALFVVLRAMNIYGDPAPWSVQPRGFVSTVLSFLTVSKYPPSLLFLCLTIGVAMLLLTVFNRYENRLTGWFRVFGQVPFFYYVLHMPLIIGTALIWSYMAFGKAINLAFAAPGDIPAAYEPSLFRTYLVLAGVIALLYFPCRWFANYRKQNRRWWLSYL
jgi:uncharacterized membrane protein